MKHKRFAGTLLPKAKQEKLIPAQLVLPPPQPGKLNYWYCYLLSSALRVTTLKSGDKSSLGYIITRRFFVAFHFRNLKNLFYEFVFYNHFERKCIKVSSIKFRISMRNLDHFIIRLNIVFPGIVDNFRRERLFEISRSRYISCLLPRQRER